MTRNLDLTALRSFVAVADAGGVTRAAAQLNLTQSAVSMQLKRLEESLGQAILDRSARKIGLTAQGELLLSYGRKLIDLNDEVWGRMTSQAFEGEIDFGVPHDIIYPHVPRILQGFAAAYPRVNVKLHSLYTIGLKELQAGGEMDLILTTERELDPGGESLSREPLVWIGACGGQAWRADPLRFASAKGCLFKRPALDALEGAGLAWELGTGSVSLLAVEASVAADLAISASLKSAVPATCEIVRHGGRLPELPEYGVNMYVTPGPREALAGRLAALVRQNFGGTLGAVAA